MATVLLLNIASLLIIKAFALEIKILHQNKNKTLLQSSKHNDISYGYTLPMINMCLGTPMQCSVFVLDTFTPFSWINSLVGKTSHPFNKNHSSTFQTLSQSLISIEYDYYYIMGSPSSEKAFIPPSITFPHENYSFLNVFSLDNLSLSYDGVIGLPQRYSYNTIANRALVYQISLIDILLKEKLIKNKMFSIRYTSENKGILRIGDLPSCVNQDDIKKIYTNQNNKREIDELYLQTCWNVIIESFVFGQYKRSPFNTIRQNGVISTGQIKVLFPSSLSWLNDYIISEARKYSSNCSIGRYNDMEYVYCEPFDVFQMPNASIHLANYTLTIRQKDLFVWSERHLGMLECVIQKKETLNYWMIGHPAFRNEFMVFDMDNKYIGFITQDVSIDEEQLLFPKGIYGSVSFMLIAMTICLLFIYKRLSSSVKTNTQISFLNT